MRCDHGASCPCGCECGTPNDPGLCYVPNEDTSHGCSNADNGTGKNSHNADDDDIQTQGVYYLSALPETAMVVEPELSLAVQCDGVDSFAVTVQSSAPTPNVFVTSTAAGVFSDNNVFVIPSTPTKLDFASRVKGGNLSCEEFKSSLKVYAASKRYPVTVAA